MPEPLHLITDSNQIESLAAAWATEHHPGPGHPWHDYDVEAAFTAGYRLSDLGLIAEAVHRIDHRTAAIEQEMRAMLTAWSVGGLRALRQAARGTPNGG